MLYKYECGCVGMAPDGHPNGSLIVMACDTTGDDNLPSNLGKIVANRRPMKNPENHKPLTEKEIAAYFEAVVKLKILACLGQDFISLNQRARQIAEYNNGEKKK